MVRDIKYIIKRVIIGVLIALIIYFLKDKSFILASAKSYNMTPQTITMVTTGDAEVTRDVTSFYVGSYSKTFYGYTSNSNPSSWRLFRFFLTKNNNIDSGIKNVSFVFYQGFNDLMLDRFTFTIIDNQQHVYSCTSDSSNNVIQGEQYDNVDGKPKEFVSVICPNIYYDKNNNYSIDINMNNAISSNGSWGITAPTFTDTDGSEIQSAVNEGNAIQQQTQDFLKDDEEASTDDFIDDLKSNESSSSPVSDLIVMPITLLQAYLNGFDATCSSYNLGSLYGHQISLPCIQPQRYLGSSLWSTIDILISLFLTYNVGLMCISIYESITSLDDNFQTLYTPRHAKGDYQPKHAKE